MLLLAWLQNLMQSSDTWIWHDRCVLFQAPPPLQTKINKLFTAQLSLWCCIQVIRCCWLTGEVITDRSDKLAAWMFFNCTETNKNLRNCSELKLPPFYFEKQFVVSCSWFKTSRLLVDFSLSLIWYPFVLEHLNAPQVLSMWRSTVFCGGAADKEAEPEVWHDISWDITRWRAARCHIKLKTNKQLRDKKQTSQH